MKPLFQGIGGCGESSLLSCFMSGNLFLMFLGLTLFDFIFYTVVFYFVHMLLFVFTRSVTANKYYKQMFLFIFIKIILFAILLFRDFLPVNFIYLFFMSMFLFYLVEVRLAYNELMVGDSKKRLIVAMIPSGMIGFVKVGGYYIVYSLGLIVVTWQLYSRMMV